jgi:hypothetical protein
VNLLEKYIENIIKEEFKFYRFDPKSMQITGMSTSGDIGWYDDIDDMLAGGYGDAGGDYGDDGGGDDDGGDDGGDGGE